MEIKKHMPKVKFEVDKEKDKQMCSDSYFSKFIRNYDKSIPPAKFVEKVYSENLKEIVASKERLEKSWNVVNDKVMERLVDIIQIHWPERNPKAIMSVNEVCPRSVKDWYFYISYFLDVEMQKGIVLHELTHLIYFEKWKQIFPNYKIEEFDKYYLVWELSEILVEPINKDKELRQFVPKTAKAYDRYYSTKLQGGESVIDHFTKLYENNKDDFGNMLKIAYSDIEKLKVFEKDKR